MSLPLFPYPELSRAETVRAVEAIFALSPEAASLIGPKEEIIYWNRAAEELFGWPLAEVKGRSMHFLIPEFVLEQGELRRLHEHTLEHGMLRPHRTMRQTRDRRVIPVELTRTPLQTTDGETLWLGLLRDLTHRQRLEAQLRQTDRLSVLGTLIAGLAHEIGTPLNVITGNAELLLERLAETPDADPAIAQTLGAIMRSSDRVANLIRSLLTLSRQTEDMQREVQLNDIVREISLLLSSQMRHAGVVLETATDPALPKVPGDRAQFQQAILSLVMNAWQAIEGRGTVTIRTAVEELEGALRAVVRIVDTGSGIAPQHLSRIFDPFFTTKEVGKGTGLGLYVAFQIAQAQDALLFVERTAPGEGTTFVFSPPLASGSHHRRDADFQSPSTE